MLTLNNIYYVIQSIILVVLSLSNFITLTTTNLVVMRRNLFKRIFLKHKIIYYHKGDNKYSCSLKTTHY